MSPGPKVSVITPVHNGAAYLGEAIGSVLGQTHEDWELLIVDDGSTDDTRDVMAGFQSDPRVRCFFEEHHGVGAARNTALAHATGDWILCLDADDRLPAESMAVRLRMADSTPAASFIDGTVEVFDARSNAVTHTWKPSYRGAPLRTLLFETPRCFYGQSWMIRNRPDLVPYQVGMTHAEDLLFYIANAGSGLYDFVDAPVLSIRRGHGSAMQDLRGLERGYLHVLREVRDRLPGLGAEDVERLRQRYRRIVWRSYLKQGRVVDALRAATSFGADLGD